MRSEESKLKLTVQLTSSDTEAPPLAKITRWVKAALSTDAEITVRFVDEAEARQLNRDYRGRDYSTNVLSFLYESGPPLSGDVALCLPLARAEAEALGLSVDSRVAHLLVHAVLHLQGYDHEVAGEAAIMEATETRILAKFGFANPYAESEGDEDMTGHSLSCSILDPQSSILNPQA